MRLTLVIILLAATAAAQATQGCKASFYFIYNDTLGNEYAGIQGKELHELEKRLSKKEHNEICLADIRDKKSKAEYVFHVVAETRNYRSSAGSALRKALEDAQTVAGRYGIGNPLT